MKNLGSRKNRATTHARDYPLQIAENFWLISPDDITPRYWHNYQLLMSVSAEQLSFIAAHLPNWPFPTQEKGQRRV